MNLGLRECEWKVGTRERAVGGSLVFNVDRTT